ncbi:MAG: hypothetical protein ACKO80_07330, partial [Acidimicrobiaceae bacterium]
MSTIIREESVTVTLTSSADVTVDGKADSPLPIIGKSKSWAEIKTGRISSKGGDVSDFAALLDETFDEFVFGVTAFEEHDEIVAMK